MWTPSSPHFALPQTTSATLGRQRSALVLRHPSLEAKCLPWPSLPVGAVSPARGTSTATPTPNCAMPTLPDRSQFNRLVRSCTELIEAFALHLATLLVEVGRRPYQALDSSAMPVRDCKRRGHGWLAGYAERKWGTSSSIRSPGRGPRRWRPRSWVASSLGQSWRRSSRSWPPAG